MIRLKNLYRIPFLLLALIAATSCKKAPSELPPPNIVWITSEDNSKHYLKLFDDNGVSTPNIDKLAQNGLIFEHAFSNAPVCSVARSTLISGCFSPRIGAQFHRKFHSVPMPGSLKMFPFYLREAGYYTSNNNKKDYNIIESEYVWNESSSEASWRKRAGDQPFFHIQNIGVSHESSLHFTKEEMDSISTHTGMNSFEVQPNHPDDRIFRYTNAYYRDRILDMDRKVGEILDELDEDGLLENTFIFYFGDHGGVLPGSKGYLFETGLHVPLVVHIPEKYRHLAGKAGREQAFVSFIDFGPTVLNLAGVTCPEGMDGKAFLGPGVTEQSMKKRDEVFSYADRFDEKYDLVRAVRKGNYKYVRNFQPFNFDGLMNNYRYKQLAYQNWQDLFTAGKLDDMQSAFFRFKEPEWLFDLDNDPYETENLAGRTELLPVLKDMRKELNDWIKGMPDLSFYPEYYLVDSAMIHPVEFGKTHKQDIARYVDIANLSLSNFANIKERLMSSLQSPDPWDRYWALITSTALREKNKDLKTEILSIEKNDPVRMNRVRAAEFLAIVHGAHPAETMTTCLYATHSPSEALLILNSIVLMQSWEYGYEFNIEPDRISKTVKGDNEVKRRLEFLNLM
jgi:arylsulfatase A-like enzyme